MKISFDKKAINKWGKNDCHIEFGISGDLVKMLLGGAYTLSGKCP